MPLVTPERRGPGRPRKDGTLPAAKEAAQKALDSAAGKTTKRKMPEDAGELNKVLAPYKIFAVPVVGAVSSCFELMDTKPLSAPEKDSGEQAIAAVLYQEGAQLDAKLLLLLWGLSVSGPRLAQKAAQHRAKKQKTPVIENAPNLDMPKPKPVEVLSFPAVTQ